MKMAKFRHPSLTNRKIMKQVEFKNESIVMNLLKKGFKVEGRLWLEETEDGKFIGLDHEIPLGANGIALSDYTGVKVTPAPVTPAAEDEPKTTETFDVTTSEATETGSGQIDSSNSGVVSELVGKATKELIIVAVIAVVLIIIIAAARIAVSHWSKKRNEQEEIILQDNNDLTVDEKESNEINSLGKNTDDNSEDN